MKKRIAATGHVATIAIAVAVFIAGCGGSDQAGQSPSTSPTPAVTATTPAWQARYTTIELKAYKASLARFQSYEQASEPIWAAGQATAAAKKILQRYFIPWQAQWAVLRQYESAGIRTEGLPRVLSSKATRIKLDDKSADVVIEQCVDFSTAKVTQRNKEIAPVTQKPQLREVDMNYVDGKWLIFKVTNAQGGDRPCDA